MRPLPFAKPGAVSLAVLCLSLSGCIDWDGAETAFCDDNAACLTVDPRLTFAQRLGGSASDSVQIMEKALDGSIYLAGKYVGVGDLGVPLPEYGQDEVFLAKFAPTGELIWARGIGGTGNEHVASLAQDTGGNVYVIGDFDSPTVKLSDTLSMTRVGLDTNGMVVKFSAAGEPLFASGGGSTTAGGFVRYVSAAPVAELGLYVAATVRGTVLEGTLNTPEATSAVVVMGETGAVSFALPFVPCTAGTSEALAIRVAPNPTPSVISLFFASRYTGTCSMIEATNPALPVISDPAVMGLAVHRITSNSANWATPQSQTNAVFEPPVQIHIDAAGNPVVVGSFRGEIVGADSVAHVGQEGSTDVGVLRLGVVDGVATSVDTAGGAGTDRALGSALDADGSLWVAGSFEDTARFGDAELQSRSETDAFVAHLDPAGTTWLSAERFGGKSSESASGVVVTGDGIYFGGTFDGFFDVFGQDLTPHGEDGFFVLYKP